VDGGEVVKPEFGDGGKGEVVVVVVGDEDDVNRL